MRCNNAFHKTGLEDILHERAVADVAVAGLATQYSVEHTVGTPPISATSSPWCATAAVRRMLAAADASFAAMALLAEVKSLDEMAF